MDCGQKLKLLAMVGGLIAAGVANAETVVATIDGAYDDPAYDTPNLIFHNTSGGTFINAQMVLTPYDPGTLTFGEAPQTVALPNMAAGDTTISWNGAETPGNLFATDYDDSWGNDPAGYTNPNCVVGTALCALVGNFSVTFTATISGGTFDGQSIFSVFSPDSNQTGGFIGWEGLDPTGLSETIYDQHSGSTSTVNGTLANIDLGTPPPATPEPGTWVTLLSGLGLLGVLARRKQKAV